MNRLGRRRFRLSILVVVSLLVLTLVLTANATSEDDEVENEAVPCPSQCLDMNLAKDKRSPGAHIFYLVLLHNERTVQDALPLFRSIRDPRNTVVFHVDKKAKQLLLPENESIMALRREIDSCACGSTVRIDSVHHVEWSKWSMNLPTLWGMRIAVRAYAAIDWDVFINLSGDTLPVYASDAMAETLDNLPYNFVTSRSCETGLLPTNVYKFPSWWHKRSHYTREGTEPDPVIVYTDKKGETRNQTMVTHFGSQWVILQRKFCVWLVDEMSRRDSLPSKFADYLQMSGKLMTDETFIPTLIMHMDPDLAQLPKLYPSYDTDDDEEDGIDATETQQVVLWKNQTLSDITDVRYERMDEHIPTAFGRFWTQQRYIVPEDSLADEPRAWGPYFLGVYDLANIRKSGALFVRKVSLHVDPNMVQLLPVSRREEIPEIQWPIEVIVTEKPDWHRRFQEIQAVMEEERGKALHDEKHDDEL
jgi:hypothetical protein